MKAFIPAVFGLLLAGGSGLIQARPQFSNFPSRPSGSSSSSASSLVSQIITQLTPFVQEEIQNALGSRPAQPSFGSGSGSLGFGSGSGSGLGGSIGGGAGGENEPFDDNPQYTYSYQVANDEKQTYIAKQETRDGAEVEGEYSYVDPKGTLITVRYTANDDGYMETREEQVGFLSLSGPSSSSSAGTSSNSDLVSKIIAQLKPHISTTVNDALSGNRYGK